MLQPTRFANFDTSTFKIRLNLNPILSDYALKLANPNVLHRMSLSPTNSWFPQTEMSNKTSELRCCSSWAWLVCKVSRDGGGTSGSALMAVTWSFRATLGRLYIKIRESSQQAVAHITASGAVYVSLKLAVDLCQLNTANSLRAYGTLNLTFLTNWQLCACSNIDDPRCKKCYGQSHIWP